VEADRQGGQGPPRAVAPGRRRQIKVASLHNAHFNRVFIKIPSKSVLIVRNITERIQSSGIRCMQQW
jgi:hypothetical protein